jgi:hypothetical protein
VVHSLESARIKLKRANLHAATARREAKRFYARNPQQTFKVNPVGEERVLGVGDVFAFELMVDKGWPDLPDSFAARFGDAIHNYRSALDHIAWQLVCHGGRPPDVLTERERRRIQFLFCDREEAFAVRAADRLPGVGVAVVDFIKGTPPVRRRERHQRFDAVLERAV